jgi:hypothetical protein
MAPARDLCFTPATELMRLCRARRVSPLELMHKNGPPATP